LGSAPGAPDAQPGLGRCPHSCPAVASLPRPPHVQRDAGPARRLPGQASHKLLRFPAGLQRTPWAGDGGDGGDGGARAAAAAPAPLGPAPRTPRRGSRERARSSAPWSAARRRHGTNDKVQTLRFTHLTALRTVSCGVGCQVAPGRAGGPPRGDRRRLGVARLAFPTLGVGACVPVRVCVCVCACARARVALSLPPARSLVCSLARSLALPVWLSRTR
jgi:hypothetical protein